MDQIEIPTSLQPWKQVSGLRKIIDKIRDRISRIRVRDRLIRWLGGVLPSVHEQLKRELAAHQSTMVNMVEKYKKYYDDNVEAMRVILPELKHLNGLMRLAPYLYPNIDPKTAVVLFLESSYLEAMIESPGDVLETILGVENERKTMVLELINNVHGTLLAKIPYVDGKVDGTVEVYDAAKTAVMGNLIVCKRVRCQEGKVLGYELLNEEVW